jgi:serine/threonine protein kinase
LLCLISTHFLLSIYSKTSSVAKGGRDSWVYNVRHRIGAAVTTAVLKMWPSCVFSVKEKELETEVGRMLMYKGNRGLKIKHPDVRARLRCPFPGASTEDDCRGILLEMCDTDLSRYIQNLGQRRVFDEKTARWRVAEYLHFDPEIKRSLVKEVLSTYNECHANGIGHRDVKPDNMLVNHVNCELTVKLCDFAISARFKSEGTSAPTRVITENEGFTWAAPEMLNKTLVKAKISHDLWGIGW